MCGNFLGHFLTPCTLRCVKEVQLCVPAFQHPRAWDEVFHETYGYAIRANGQTKNIAIEDNFIAGVKRHPFKGDAWYRHPLNSRALQPERTSRRKRVETSLESIIRSQN